MQKKQSLNNFSLTMIVVSLIIGMGIFKTPAIVAAKSGNVYIFFSVWIIGGIITLFGALTYAEIGQRLPFIGGYYKIFSTCYHPSIGFTINILILISNAATLAIVSLIGSDYFSDLVFGQPCTDFFKTFFAIFCILFFYLINLKGLKTSSYTQNILTIFKIILMVVLCLAIFKGNFIAPHGYNQGIIYSENEHNYLFLFLVSLGSVAFTYGGYQQTVNFGGEVKSYSSFRKSIVISVCIVIVLYLLVNLSYILIIGFDKMKNANVIGALIFESLFGKYGAKVFDFCMVLSVFAYVNVILLSNPRVMYAMSEDKVLPAFFSKRNQESGVIFYSLSFFALLTIIVIFFGKKIEDLINFSIFIDCIGMVSSAYTFYILKKRNKTNTAHSPKYMSVLVAIFILFYIVVGIGVIDDNSSAAITAVFLLIIVFLLYWGVNYKKIKNKS